MDWFVKSNQNEIDMITIITGGTGSIKLLRGLDSVVNEKINLFG